MNLDLLVGPFPSYITDHDKKSLMDHFRAIEVTTLKRKQLKNGSYGSSFLKSVFSTEADCLYALKNLHQMKLPKGYLSCKYYEKDKHDKIYEKNINVDHSLSCSEDDPSSKLYQTLKTYEANLNAISSQFGASFPINPKLRYSYPPPSSNVLANVVRCLVNNKKFYTQVMHLMNKMNLPCPFVEDQGDLESDFLELITDSKENETKQYSTSSESELESDRDDSAEVKMKQLDIINKKRRIRRKKQPISKKTKFELLKQSIDKVLLPTSGSVTQPKEVFELPSTLNTKKLELKLVSTSLESARDGTSAAPLEGEGFGKIHPHQKETFEKKSSFVSEKELLENRVAKEDWPVVPVFKNYCEGEPSCRLYLKNLSKKVTEADLKYVFGRFVDWDAPMDDDSNRLTIRLMKEGRMKDQAFVAFAKECWAKEACYATNGFILKDKPMVVMFGKVKSTKTTDEQT